MNSVKLWTWAAMLFVFVVIKFSFFTLIWIPYGIARHISQHGFRNIDCCLRASLISVGRMWRKYVFFWLDEW